MYVFDFNVGVERSSGLGYCAVGSSLARLPGKLQYLSSVHFQEAISSKLYPSLRKSRPRAKIEGCWLMRSGLTERMHLQCERDSYQHHRGHEKARDCPGSVGRPFLRSVVVIDCFFGSERGGESASKSVGLVIAIAVELWCVTSSRKPR